MGIIGTPLTSAMFLLRVRAVYANGKTIIIFFGLLFLADFATELFVPFHLVTMYLGPGQGCSLLTLGRQTAIPILLHSAFDTLVFIAISFRIASYSIVGDTFNGRVRSLFRGEGLPSLSRRIIMGGQLYYLFVNFYLAIFPSPHGFVLVLHLASLFSWPYSLLRQIILSSEPCSSSLTLHLTVQWRVESFVT
jgi:hypothetical protein